MKKIISLLLVLTFAVSVASCSGSNPSSKTEVSSSTVSSASTVSSGSISKDEYDKMTADDLIGKIKDSKNITEDDMIMLGSTYAYVNINDDLTLAQNITDDAFSKLYESDASFPNSDNVIEKLIKSDSPQVRGYALSLMSSLFGVDSDSMKLAKELIAKETEPYVLLKATNALANEGSDSEIGAFLIKMASYDNPVIRTNAVYALGNSWSVSVDGAADTIIKLMNDEDSSVRSAACRYAGNLYDESVIDPLVAILNNDAEYELHGDCINSLTTMWYDYPFHEHTSEKAYNATMDYWKKTPRTENIPDWTSFSNLESKSDTSFDAWKAKATYYNADDIINVMTDIIKDSDADWMARTSAVNVVATQGTPEQFKSLGSIINGLTDDKASFIVNSYNQKLESINAQ